MNLHTSGDVKAQAKIDRVAAVRLDEFVRRFHAKCHYLNPDAAYTSCLAEEKKLSYSGHPGQVPIRRVGNM